MRRIFSAMYAMFFLVVSCNHGTAPQTEPGRTVIMFGIDGCNGMTGKFMGGVYLDNKGNRYQVAPPVVQTSIAEYGYRNDSIAAVIMSQGTITSNVVPSDSMSLMLSLISEVKLSTDSVRTFQGADMGGTGWFTFDPVSVNGRNYMIELKETGSWDYRLLSDQSAHLTAMIDRYCTHLAGPSRVQLIRTDGLFSDTLYPAVAFACDTSNDTEFTGDSNALLINPALTELRFTFKSFDDNLNYQTFNISGVRMFKKGDTTVILGDYAYWVSDAIAMLPQSRKYSLNSTIRLNNPLAAGNYKFVGNITEYCYCLGFPTYNCVGNFFIGGK
jgi:hypothetical protein